MMRRRVETMVLVKMGKQLASQTWETNFVTQRKSRKCNQSRSAENNAQLMKRAGNWRTCDQKKSGKTRQPLETMKSEALHITNIIIIVVVVDDVVYLVVVKDDHCSSTIQQERYLWSHIYTNNLNPDIHQSQRGFYLHRIQPLSLHRSEVGF